MKTAKQTAEDILKIICKDRDYEKEISNSCAKGTYCGYAMHKHGELLLNNLIIEIEAKIKEAKKWNARER